MKRQSRFNELPNDKPSMDDQMRPVVAMMEWQCLSRKTPHVLRWHKRPYSNGASFDATQFGQQFPHHSIGQLWERWVLRSVPASVSAPVIPPPHTRRSFHRRTSQSIHHYRRVRRSVLGFARAWKTLYPDADSTAVLFCSLLIGRPCKRQTVWVVQSQLKELILREFEHQNHSRTRDSDAFNLTTVQPDR